MKLTSTAGEAIKAVYLIPQWRALQQTKIEFFDIPSNSSIEIRHSNSYVFEFPGCEWA